MFKKLAFAASFSLAAFSAYAEMADPANAGAVLSASGSNSFASASQTCLTALGMRSGPTLLSGTPQCLGVLVDGATVTQFVSENGLKFLTRTKTLDIAVQENGLGNGIPLYYLAYYDAAGRVNEVLVVIGALQ